MHILTPLYARLPLALTPAGCLGALPPGAGPRALIAETIDMVAVLSGRGSQRRLAELARVEGLGPDGDYRITHPSPWAIPTSTGESS